MVLFLFTNGKTVYLNKKHDGPWMKVGLFFNPQLVKKVNLNKKLHGTSITPNCFLCLTMLLVLIILAVNYWCCKKVSIDTCSHYSAYWMISWQTASENIIRKLQLEVSYPSAIFIGKFKPKLAYFRLTIRLIKICANLICRTEFELCKRITSV